MLAGGRPQPRAAPFLSLPSFLALLSQSPWGLTLPPSIRQRGGEGREDLSISPSAIRQGPSGRGRTGKGRGSQPPPIGSRHPPLRPQPSPSAQSQRSFSITYRCQALLAIEGCRRGEGENPTYRLFITYLAGKSKQSQLLHESLQIQEWRKTLRIPLPHHPRSQHLVLDEPRKNPSGTSKTESNVAFCGWELSLSV